MSWLISRAMMEQCGSLRCSPEPVAASSADICSDGEPSAPSSATPTPQAYLWRDKMTDAWRRFPSGMTCEPLTADRGEELLTLYLAGFPAKTFPQPDAVPESKANDPDCGVKWPGSLAKYDRVSRSWKTRQCLLLGDLAEYAETWPSWGTTVDGELFRQPTPSSLLAIRARITCGKESGLLLHTPKASDAVGTARTSDVIGKTNRQRDIRTDVARMKLPTPTARDWRSGKASEATMQRNSRPLSEKIGGKLNPQWVEWLMGWPIGWTDCEPLGTDKWQQWRQWHGDY